MSALEWGPSSSSSSTARATIVLGCSLGVSFILLVVAGALPGGGPGQWLPMVNVVAVLFIPVAIVLADSVAGSGASYAAYDETRAAYANFGACASGTLLASFLALPLTLFHAGLVDARALGFWLGSSVLTLGGALFYWFSRGRSLTSAF